MDYHTPSACHDRALQRLMMAWPPSFTLPNAHLRTLTVLEAHHQNPITCPCLRHQMSLLYAYASYAAWILSLSKYL